MAKWERCEAGKNSPHNRHELRRACRFDPPPNRRPNEVKPPPGGFWLRPASARGLVVSFLYYSFSSFSVHFVVPIEPRRVDPFSHNSMRPITRSSRSNHLPPSASAPPTTSHPAFPQENAQ
ncbi:hypothetical protein N657DRAFT_113447 [Parathielavia appendiculata]|uniref:Uncharacterized protein n=1 Tax=Parathielavia appendiculata TaxID=2587402 RepID=A0AAN6TVS8_9PEZI|nr:hypothetical protein N657DRAFT_113447 [Parathielavia appendiculata]